MNKTRFVFLTLALLTMLPAVASAQMELGFRGGLNLSSFGGSDVDADFGFTGTRTALNIGAFVNVPVSDIFSVQIGGAYSKKGGQETEAGVDVTFALDYVEFPILAKISPSTAGSVGFDLFLGPTVGFKSSCKVTGDEGGVSVSFDCDDPLLDISVKSIDLGATAGVGLNIAVNDQASALIQTFYTLGLGSLDDAATDPDDIKNRGFAILVGLSYTLGG